MPWPECVVLTCLERHQEVPWRCLSCPGSEECVWPGRAGLQDNLVPCWALCQFCCCFWVYASCHWNHHVPQAVHDSPAPGEGSDVVFFSCYVLQHFIWRIMPSLSRIFTVGVRHLFSFKREFKQLSPDATDHSVCYLTCAGASYQLRVQLFMFF